VNELWHLTVSQRKGAKKPSRKAAKYWFCTFVPLRLGVKMIRSRVLTLNLERKILSFRYGQIVLDVVNYAPLPSWRAARMAHRHMLAHCHMLAHSLI
jgi:hypothetical protein